ncbi:MAG: hypothetical protein M1812_007066 [Candelaria pacifica]|nr:MAG: hypothetical protein M1812_007066 [Candelaria pacifica]
MPLLEDQLVEVRLKTLPADSNHTYFTEYVDPAKYPRRIIPPDATSCEAYIIPQEDEKFVIEVTLKAGYRFHSASHIGIELFFEDGTSSYLSKNIDWEILSMESMASDSKRQLLCDHHFHIESLKKNCVDGSVSWKRLSFGKLEMDDETNLMGVNLEDLGSLKIEVTGVNRDQKRYQPPRNPLHYKRLQLVLHQKAAFIPFKTTPPHPATPEAGAPLTAKASQKHKQPLKVSRQSPVVRLLGFMGMILLTWQRKFLDDEPQKPKEQKSCAPMSLADNLEEGDPHTDEGDIASDSRVNTSPPTRSNCLSSETSQLSATPALATSTEQPKPRTLYEYLDYPLKGKPGVQLSYTFKYRSAEALEALKIDKRHTLTELSWDELSPEERPTVFKLLQTANDDYAFRARTKEESEGIEEFRPPEWKPFSQIREEDRKGLFEILQAKYAKYTTNYYEFQRKANVDRIAKALKDPNSGAWTKIKPRKRTRPTNATHSKESATESEESAADSGRDSGLEVWEPKIITESMETEEERSRIEDQARHRDNRAKKRRLADQVEGE